MAIDPRQPDIGRKVKLTPYNGQPEYGQLVRVCAPDRAHSVPFAMVKYPTFRVPVATYLDKLDWAD